MIGGYPISIQSTLLTLVRDGPFDIQGGGGWDFFEENSFFLAGVKK